MPNVLKRYGDFLIGLLALAWAVCAFMGVPSDAQPQPDVSLFVAMAHLCSWQIAGAFGFAALARARMRLLADPGVALLLMLLVGCAHAAPVGKGVDVIDASAATLSVALAGVTTPEARKAEDALDEIRDALELLRVLAPAIDAEIEKDRGDGA